MAEHCYAVFASTSLAMKAKSVAKKQSISVKLTTIPRQLSRNCNVGLKTSPANQEKLEKILQEAGIECKISLWAK